MFVKKEHEIPKHPLKEIANTNNTNVYVLKLATYDNIVIMKKFKEDSYEHLMEFIVREINYLVNIHHPNIVTILEIWPDGPLPTLIMEYAGKNLWEYGEQLSRYERGVFVKPIFEQIFNGLNFLHFNRIIHRDLKSTNILIKINDKKEAIPIVKICDLGLTRTIYYEMTPNSGTPNYRPPEILESEINYDEKVDMWAMGCIVYEWLEHNILFRGSNENTLLERIHNWMSSKVENINNLIKNARNLEKPNIKYVQNIMNVLLLVDPKSRASAIECLKLLNAEITPVMHIHKPILIRKSTQVDLNIRHIIIANILDMERYYDVNRKTLALGIDLFDKWLMVTGGNDDMVLYSIASVILASYKYKVLSPINFASKYTEEIIAEAVQTLFKIINYNIEYLDMWSLMGKIVKQYGLPRSDEHVEHYWKRVCDLLLDYNSIFAKTEQELIELLDHVVD